MDRMVTPFRIVQWIAVALMLVGSGVAFAVPVIQLQPYHRALVAIIIGQVTLLAALLLAVHMSEKDYKALEEGQFKCTKPCCANEQV